MFLENHFQTRHCIEKIIGHEFTYHQNWGFHYKSMKIDDLEYEWHHSTTHNLSPCLGWCNFHEWHHQQCMFDPAGRYEDDFVSERMRQLQLWVDRMVRHPVISQSEVFNHFLTCTDEKVMLHMYNLYNSPVYRVVVFDNGVVHVHVCTC